MTEAFWIDSLPDPVLLLESGGRKPTGALPPC